MDHHRVRYIDFGDSQWQAKCSCRRRSHIGTKADAKAWEWDHHHEIQKVRAMLARTPSLRASRDYYREQARDFNNSAQERDLWQALADELDSRVAEPDDEGQLKLWEES